MAREYRYEVEASLCFSVMADSAEEADAKARAFAVSIESDGPGAEVRDVGEAVDIRVYTAYADPSGNGGKIPECVDVGEGDDDANRELDDAETTAIIERMERKQD